MAHGREPFPSADEFFRLHDENMNTMELLKDEILAASRTKGYLATA